MYKIILFLSGLFSICTISFGQVANDKIIFVIDSILVINDPEEGNEILQADIADITVIKNQDTLNHLGYGKFDGATFIFTKEYRNRPDSLKQIPSSKQMEGKMVFGSFITFLIPDDLLIIIIAEESRKKEHF
jgi:hypothetical protein